MKILHFSDLHVWRLGFDPPDFHPKRLLGLANLALRRRRAFAPGFGRATLLRIERAIEEESPDLVVFSGDMTTTALAAEFEQAREWFAPLIRRLGERFYLLPGNHDRYTPRAAADELFERAFPSGRFGGRPARIRTLAIGERAAAVGFDVCVPRLISSRGEFTPALAEALELELERRAREGRAVILIGHYPYAVPAGIRVSSEHRLNGAGRLIEIVARHKPALYLHGHKHIRWALRPAATPETLCVNAGPAGRDSSDAAKRAGFVLIEGALERGAAQGGAEFRAEAFALAPAGVEIARRYRRGEPLETLRDLPFDRAPLAAVSG